MSEETAIDVLASLSSYLGAGLGDDKTTADQYDMRIRWGIDYQHNAIVRLCAETIERLSKTPNTTWGDVKAEIMKLSIPSPPLPYLKTEEGNTR